MYKFIRPLVDRLTKFDAEREIRSMNDVHAY
jgi:hypothetical protein